MKRNTLLKAAILGGTAVILGAFGAHALKEVLLPEQLSSFQTGVHYQLVHAVVLLFLALISSNGNQPYFLRATQFFFWGVVLFSGSIYVLTLKNLLTLDWLRFVGPITPVGGTLIIVGWGCLLLGAIKSPENVK